MHLKKAQQYTCQVHSKFTHHFDLNLPTGHIENKFKMNPSGLFYLIGGRIEDIFKKALWFLS